MARLWIALPLAVASFVNPVIEESAPDPGVAKFGDTWYMVTTSESGTNATGVFPIRTSKDLVNWNVVGKVFPENNVPGWTKSDYWAPEIHRVGAKYHVYYTAREAGILGRIGIGVAVADSPLGPYTDLGEPLILGSGPSDLGGAIDGHFFRDDDRRQYFVWKINQLPPFAKASLHIREMDASGLAWAEGSSPKKLLEPDLPWEGESVGDACVEAPWMIKHDVEYFLFYSAQTTFATKYAVGVARASSVEGPYTKACAPVLSQFASDSHSSVRHFATTGHCSVVVTEQGFAMVYHAYRADAVLGDRVVLVDRIAWDEDGWPVVGNCGTPTLSPQPMPNVSAERAPACLEKGQVYRMDWDATGAPMHTPGSSEFRVLPGKCPGGSVSLELTDKPGHFVRHKDGKLRVDVDDGSDLFSRDSSFMAQPGLHGNELGTTSLRPVNYPYNFVMQQDGVVLQSSFEETAEFQAAATWTPSSNSHSQLSVV